jgi:D-glycero-alpha-D-manno-heptose 1-phosphate guanylyltransferase
MIGQTTYDQKDPTTPLMPALECIVLAGGLGTRLRSEVADLPKCMAPVNGQPFLNHVIRFLHAQGVTRFIFSLGYLHEIIETHLQTIPDLNYTVVIETEPLGTGGAILLATKACTQENVLIVNGDTAFHVSIPTFIDFHLQHQSICTLALKPMPVADRYGLVNLNASGSIQSFEEKKNNSSGLINGGIYALNRTRFLQLNFPDKFSFEQDFLLPYHQSERMFGFVQDAYFIDIGIPEDYRRAQTELN